MDFGVNLLTRGITGGAEGFRAVAAPPFAERGKVTDEFLAAFHELWTSDAPRVTGTYVNLSDAGVRHFLSFSAPAVSEALADLAWSAGEVRPLVAGRSP